jgi:cytolysin (calcineurin-like family phosphatase)
VADIVRNSLKAFVLRSEEEFFKLAVPGVTYAILADHNGYSLNINAFYLPICSCI